MNSIHLLQELGEISASIGADPMLTQGAGGNTSIKLDGKLWIKASGTWLADAADQSTFISLNLEGVRRRLMAGEQDPATPEVCGEAGAGRRPSIESSLHAIMPQRVVFHVHAINTIAHAVRSDCRSVLAPLLAGLKWELIPYARPGVPLTRLVEKAISARPDVLVLSNHGLVVGADTLEQATSLLFDVERRLSIAPRPVNPFDSARLRSIADGSNYELADHDEIHGIATDPANLALATRGALYPDHVVFFGRSPLPAVDPENAREWIAQHQNSSDISARMLLVRGLGALVRADCGRGTKAMAHCLGLLSARIDHSSPIVYLDEIEEVGLLGWDAEKYRQALERPVTR